MSGIAVYVCGETGDKLTTPIAIDGGDARYWISTLIPPVTDVGSPCWRFIDPYGDTTINRLQLPAFIDELERIAEGASGAQRGRLAEIRSEPSRSSLRPYRIDI